jgi:DNA-binding NarL/FixJ family response regulator
MFSMLKTPNLRKMRQKSLLIVDDHPVYRDALAEKLLHEFGPGGTQVNVVGTTGEALDILGSSEVKWVILLDILMPGLSGMAAVKAFKNHPNTEHVVVISGLDANLWESRSMAAGASLFLSKNSTSAEMCRRLAGLLKGEIEPQINPVPATPDFRLTARQRQVLALIAEGHPNKIVAEQLEISEQTVKIHLNQIFKELRVFNRTQAVLKAQQHQLL